MKIITPRVIAPDSSHWAQWIDCALSPSRVGHQATLDFHDRLISAGRIPLMSWHHLEELLAIEDDTWARRRVAFIQALPLIAYVRFPAEGSHSGSIVDVLSAEVTAALNGATTLQEVRDKARVSLIRTGTGEEVIGTETWIWDVVRREFRRRNKDAKLIAATRSMGLFDDQRTIGEIAKGSIRTNEEQRFTVLKMRGKVLDHIQLRGDRKIADPHSMASSFMDAVQALAVPEGTDVRSLLEIALVSQGLDRDEIRDDAVLADLNDLAIFRARLKVIADNIDMPFRSLKRIDRAILPSCQTLHLLQRFGQNRQRRNGSDITDESLSALAPYVDELFVDKRTAEDFRRVQSRSEPVVRLLGRVRKISSFEGLVSP